MPGALEDIRVIDFTHALNGPFCTMLLGHLGAEIIKIEPPAGDGFRRSWMPPGAKTDAYEFLWINMNKKSVVLNLKTHRGVELARQLIARADVLVENYHVGQMEKFGLGYDALKAINPRLIYACSRGFGETGPYAHYGSTAQTNNSMTGWTHTGWQYSGAPGTKALGIGDEAAGVSMVCGILAALHARERSGEGQRIVVSMQEALMGFMISEFHEHFVWRRSRQRSHSRRRRLFHIAHTGVKRQRLGEAREADESGGFVG
jgi:crotonobetainyl-CoA:carnitine CoA-transferase CaiB-like acyl-CoA transferase